MDFLALILNVFLKLLGSILFKIFHAILKMWECPEIKIGFVS